MTAAREFRGAGFTIRFEALEGYLRAYVHDGRDSLAVSQAMWRAIGEECRRRGETRVLVVEDLVSTVDTAQVDAVVDAMADAGFASLRTAFVELRDDIQGSEYGETLCLERDMVLRVFSDEDIARRWLVYG